MKNASGYFICRKNGKSLATAQTDAGLALSDFAEETSLLFWVNDASDDYVCLINLRTGMVLDGNDSSVYMHIPNGGLYQQWQLADAGNGYKKLLHLKSGNVLTANSDGTLGLSAWSGNDDNQMWSLTFLQQLTQKATEKLVTSENTNTPGNAFMSALDDTAPQIFYFDHLGDNNYRICCQGNTWIVLGIGNDGKLCFDEWQNVTGQQWQMEDLPGGFQKLINQDAGLVLDGNGTSLYLLGWNGGDYQQWAPFVQMPVDFTKQYNQVTFAMAHDSHTDKKTSYYSSLSGSPMWEDQTQDVSEQLAGGIRAVRISTGLHSVGGENVILQHTIALKTFADYLERVRKFLDQNPMAIVTIYDEGDSSKSLYNDEEFENFLADQYAATLGGTAIAPNRIFIPGGKMPSLDELNKGNWPTLQAIHDAGIQIIVIMANNFPKLKNADNSFKHPWILPSSVFEVNPYDNLIQNADMAIRPAGVDVNLPQPLANRIFKFSHFFYSPIYVPTQGWEEESSQMLNIWTVGDLLVENTLRAWAVNGAPPTWINVDFYQGVQGAQSHLTHLVRAINSSASLAELEQKVKGCYIQNTNGLLQIGHPYTTDADTPRYNIINLRNGSLYALNLTSSVNVDGPSSYVGLGYASVAPLDVDAPSQAWYLRYNTPVHGIQLVIAWGYQYVLHAAPLQNLNMPGYGMPNVTAQIAANNPSGSDMGQDDMGWEIVSISDFFIIRKSGNPSQVLGLIGDSSIEAALSLLPYNPSDTGQMWKFQMINPEPYPSFLPGGF